MKKGNISLLVMFILLASSLLGLLSLYYVQQIQSFSRNVLSYYQSFSLAK
ncbi:hypothetical protein KA037_04220 [Patescibacteria group bacterium]|nr:hypothetical protein [Patescibacteria group bacterium]